MTLKLKPNELDYWLKYIATLKEKPLQPKVHAAIAGNLEIANQLLDLYLSGRKTAGSSLVKDYLINGDDLPEVGNFWIILDSQSNPRCIAKTIRVETYQFDQVPVEVAVAEGEGDLSLEYWRKAHIQFFTPYFNAWGVQDLDKEELVVEFFEIVFK